MNINKISFIFGGALISLALLCPPVHAEAKTSAKTTAAQKSSKSSSGSKKSSSSRSSIQTIYNNPETGEWIRKSSRGIYTVKDSTGVVRSMAAHNTNPAGARNIAAALNRYAEDLKSENVRIYSVLAPDQGEYYMPDMVGTKGNEQKTIEIVAENAAPGVTVVFVDDVLKNHVDEHIYSYTDHHWAPLGGFYAAEALAKAAGVPFRPLSDYEEVVTHGYVGTMPRFSGDSQIKNYPEDFVYYLPPEGYEAEFINYKVSNGKTVSEGAPHKDVFFKKFKEGSESSYCVFMGGDYCNVKVRNTGGPKDRKVLLVKDSFGNAVASNLFGSFEEVHVIDFRYFPHNLIDYIRENGITDVAFVNSLSIGISPNCVNRLDHMRTVGKKTSKPASIRNEEE